MSSDSSTRGLLRRLRLLGLVMTVVVLAAACGDDGEDEATDDATEATDTTEASDTSADDEAAANDDSEEAADDGAADESADSTAVDSTTDDSTADDSTAADDAADEAGGVPVELGEWYVEPAEVEAGTVTFSVRNAGENPHALAVVSAASYEELPLKDNGAVVTDELGDDFLGATDNIDSGGSGTLEVELEPGDYVLFCPIEFGPNSHAGNGQYTSVTVG